MLVGHSLGVIAVAAAAPHLLDDKVRGAFLVGMPDVERPDFVPAIDRAFAPIPRDPCPSRRSWWQAARIPHCDYEKAEDISYAWGSAIVDAGDAGHLNTESGHGPWPEGLMRFAGFPEAALLNRCKLNGHMEKNSCCGHLRESRLASPVEMSPSDRLGGFAGGVSHEDFRSRFGRFGSDRSPARWPTPNRLLRLREARADRATARR